MWHLKKELYERMQTANLISLPESWEQTYIDFSKDGVNVENYFYNELTTVASQLIKALPEHLIPYVIDGTLNQRNLPENARHHYLAWQAQESYSVQEAISNANATLMNIADKVPNDVYDVLEGGLHDAIITSVHNDDTITLLINTEGGFTPKAAVVLQFKNVSKQEGSFAQGQTILYEELRIIDGEFALRFMISTGDVITTYAKQLTAQTFYRPMAYHELIANEVLPDVTVSDFVNALNRQFSYTLLTDTLQLPILQFAIEGTQIALVKGGSIVQDGRAIVLLRDSDTIVIANDAITFATSIFTNMYEDPYAIFSEPMPDDELEDALFSNDLALIVRAWNTLYTTPDGHAELINRALVKLAQIDNTENDVMLGVYMQHFDELGLITNDTKIQLHHYL